METNPETIETTAPVVPRQNPKWVGLVMAFLLPGSAHFLSGHSRAGILWFFACLLLQLLCAVVAGIPGVRFFYITVGLFVVFILFYAAMFISSWRPTRRIGCIGWILLLGANQFNQYAIVLPSALFMKTYFTEIYAFASMGMAPTLIAPSVLAPEVQRSDRVITCKWIYRVSDPQRGDIVVFKTISPYDGSPVNYAWRVVGLPGETVDIESPHVLVNGERLTEPPIFAKIADRQDGFPGYCTAQEAGYEGVPLPLTLGADEYFLLGDNSPQSKDSRFDGPVRRQDIIGKVIRIFYPFDRMREVE